MDTNEQGAAVPSSTEGAALDSTEGAAPEAASRPAASGAPAATAPGASPQSAPQQGAPQQAPNPAPAQGAPASVRDPRTGYIYDLRQPGVPGGTVAVAPVPARSRGWIVGVVAVVAIMLITMFGIGSCTAAFESSIGSLGSVSASKPLTSGDSIGIINIDGTIEYNGSTSSPEGLKAQLDRAAKNPDIKAVVLRVNSGGGTATAGEEMAIYVRDFAKPVVVSSASMNASAAYEISSQADYIFTAETTAIGSIGTVMSVTDISGLLAKLGITVDNIASADSKDSTYGDRPLTDEEREYYQRMVDQINDTFIAKVAEGRGMSVEEVRKLATGLTFTGIDAVENGLADEIGTLETAVSKAAELGGISQYNVVYLRPEVSELSQLIALLSESRGAGASSVDLKELDHVGLAE